MDNGSRVSGQPTVTARGLIYHSENREIWTVKMKEPIEEAQTLVAWVALLSALGVKDRFSF